MKIAVVIEAVSGIWYRAECPSLPGCRAYGRSVDEARDQISRAILCYLASLDMPDPGRLELDVPDASRQQPRLEPAKGRIAGVA